MVGLFADLYREPCEQVKSGFEGYARTLWQAMSRVRQSRSQMMDGLKWILTHKLTGEEQHLVCTVCFMLDISVSNGWCAHRYV